MLTPSWTSAFQVCSSFLMNLAEKKHPEHQPNLWVQEFSTRAILSPEDTGQCLGTFVVITTAGAPGFKQAKKPWFKGTKAVCCFGQRPPTHFPVPTLSPALPAGSSHHR